MRSYPEQEWASVRTKGRQAFLFRHGVLGRGLPLGVLVAIVVEVARGEPLADAMQTPGFLLRLAFAVAIFSLSGTLAANANWNLHERRHGHT